ncbi:hypothetical protein [Marinobacterium lutimaris]|uniref:Uncharacterized protein n=1 Tax=Marinobacterium lutimaris TaxID=568106 RepID=A0A1H6C1U8_9GAMM|nr:hypothetical protein [Marinobacterium lutimaris]SEG66931.1 hypothetical protein SAMN05444390_10395 [Marinobacterium lutimaris]
MLLKSYDEQSLLFNTNFLETTSSDGFAYRGELVIEEGEVADAQGRRKPPVSLLLGAVLLEQDEKLKLLVGLLNDLSLVEALLEKYGKDLADDMAAMIFTRNIGEPMLLETDGKQIVLMPLDEGIPWNEAIDELALEKSDFKGQSSGDKLVTLYKEMKGFKPRGADTVLLEEALNRTIEVKQSARGPV